MRVAVACVLMIGVTVYVLKLVKARDEAVCESIRTIQWLAHRTREDLHRHRTTVAKYRQEMEEYRREMKTIEKDPRWRPTCGTDSHSAWVGYSREIARLSNQIDWLDRELRRIGRPWIFNRGVQ